MGSTSNSAAPARDVLAPDLSRGAPLQRKSAIYWVGVIPPREGDDASHPPMHNITLGGVTFPMRHTPWEDHRQGDDKRGDYPGYLARLTDAQVDQLKEACRRTIVRWRERTGRHAHGHQVYLVNEADIQAAKEKWKLTDAQVATYAARVGNVTIRDSDEPISKYIYCVKVDAKSGAEEGGTWRPSAQIPRPIVETGIEAP